MKLYTEEQMLKVWKAGQKYWETSGASITFEELLEHETPIELPSDEEIVNQSKYIAHNYFEMHHTNHYQGLEEGSLRMASWMRDKIKGGNDENNS